MSLRGLQVNNFNVRNEPKKSPGEEVKISPEAIDRVRAANRYFDANPPRAHSQSELDSLFKRR